MLNALSKQGMNASVFVVMVVVVVVCLLQRPTIAFVPSSSSNVFNDKSNIIFKKKTTTRTATSRTRRRNLPPILISDSFRDDLLPRQYSSSSSQAIGDDDDDGNQQAKDNIQIHVNGARQSSRISNFTQESIETTKLTTITSNDDNAEQQQYQGLTMDNMNEKDDNEELQKQEQHTSLSSWKKVSLVYLGLLGCCCMPLPRKLRSIRVSLVSIYMITPFLIKRNSTIFKLVRISFQAFWILYCINIPLLEVYFISRTYFDNKEDTATTGNNIPTRSPRRQRKERVLISLLYVFAICSAIFKEKGSIMLLGMLFVFRFLSYLRSSGAGNDYTPWWAQRIIEVVDDTFNGILAII